MSSQGGEQSRNRKGKKNAASRRKRDKLAAQRAAKKLKGPSEAEWGVDLNNDQCYVCGNGGNLLCCSHCSLVFHLECTLPILDVVPEGDWYCRICVSYGSGPVYYTAAEKEKAKEDAAKMKLLASVNSKKPTQPTPPLEAGPVYYTAAEKEKAKEDSAKMKLLATVNSKNPTQPTPPLEAVPESTAKVTMAIAPESTVKGSASQQSAITFFDSFFQESEEAQRQIMALILTDPRVGKVLPPKHAVSTHQCKSMNLPTNAHATPLENNAFDWFGTSGKYMNKHRSAGNNSSPFDVETASKNALYYSANLIRTCIMGLKINKEQRRLAFWTSLSLPGIKEMMESFGIQHGPIQTMIANNVAKFLSYTRIDSKGRPPDNQLFATRVITASCLPTPVSSPEKQAGKKDQCLTKKKLLIFWDCPKDLLVLSLKRVAI